MLDWFPNIDHLPIYVAQEEGYFKEKGYKSPQDLNGKRIGYTVPDTEEVLLGAFSRINGVRDFSLISVGFAIASSLTADKVDAHHGILQKF